MNYLPLFLDLKNKKILVIGAGEVAFNKITLLLRSEAKVNVIAKELCSEVKTLLDEKKIDWISEEFHKSFLNKTFLVISATNDSKLNQYIFNVCNDYCIFVNVVDNQSKCSFIFPSIIDRSPIIIALSSGGTAPVLLRLLREKIESILPIRLGDVAKIAGKWRKKIKQHFINFLERRRFWERLFKSIFVEYILKGNKDQAVNFLKKSIHDINLLKGEIILVGAGPGDSGLLTLRGLQVLQEADVVLYDYLISQDVLDLIRRDAKRICVGKRAGLKNITQKEINILLISLAKKGQKVVRLKGGDPFIFGRGGEEIEAAKKAEIDFQVVPGITSAIGIAAYSGIPLTDRRYSHGVIFITGHKSTNGFINNWSILCDASYTLVIYMGILQAKEISKKLIEFGRSKSTPIAIIGQGTTINQKVIIGRLDEIEKIIKLIIAPGLLIVGEVVLLHNKFKWFQT
ncbi:siroheme synthase CysG [Buchnera aphidicola]|uniref:Siroheme synthase n=1 Tax=Buchnera aphidicola str. USDA (Myzus persicae) TaxID=1009856 RepID=W0P3M8_BUCMP|nr:siroheme synthase CysG [Buchnera aphidicola]AHG59970.1 Cysg [Buchnera aphidicola str. USDA (Myzus persicae)]AHG60550.1 Cysg [Buchnera aphidicola str. W106 (Myzus persicae)]AHG61123.1 Cysg [Buchnera aphidicola str. G002 (Myzus persicae)]AHG61695.1 Cysg [Buchnera aphidicola str. F009 (Myzus persicae)]WAI03348.1 MAG: siroheme synthase CysG [Buchnera aphidicola (Myzus persicae)]